MKNLNSFGVEEMSFQECKDVQGGFWLCLLALVIGIVIGALTDPHVEVN